MASTFFLGADTGRLTALSASMESSSDELQTITSRLRSQWSEVEWNGADAEYFRCVILALTGAMTTTASALQTVAGVVQKQAEAQDTASGSAGPGGSGVTPVAQMGPTPVPQPLPTPTPVPTPAPLTAVAEGSVGPLAAGGQVTPTPGGDQIVTTTPQVPGLEGEQLSNAVVISQSAVDHGMGRRGAVIGIMTALAESEMKNLQHGDRDSQGAFQQRPSQGWGTIEQVRDINYAADKFYDELDKTSWESKDPWDAAQGVQRSFDPTGANYEARLAKANEVADAIFGPAQAPAPAPAPAPAN